jgi:hypothetical protein
MRPQAHLPQTVLAARETARSIEDAIRQELAGRATVLRVNLDGIRSMAPSFFDELIRIIEESVMADGRTVPDITIANPHRRLSAAFQAVCRAHKLKISESSEGDWLITHAHQ